MVTEHTKITLKPENYEVLVGAVVTFRCKAESDKTLDLSINWLNNGEMIDFAIKPHFVRSVDNSLTILNLMPMDSGNYTCVASTSLDKAEAQATLIVQGTLL